MINSVITTSKALQLKTYKDIDVKKLGISPSQKR